MVSAVEGPVNLAADGWGTRSGQVGKNHEKDNPRVPQRGRTNYTDWKYRVGHSRYPFTDAAIPRPRVLNESHEFRSFEPPLRIRRCLQDGWSL